jgi:hypothetical protein
MSLVQGVQDISIEIAIHLLLFLFWRLFWINVSLRHVVIKKIHLRDSVARFSYPVFSSNNISGRIPVNMPGNYLEFLEYSWSYSIRNQLPIDEYTGELNIIP